MSRRRRAAKPPGTRLVSGGAVVFGVGVVAIAVAVLPYFFGRPNTPLAVNLLTVAAPLGLGLALVGLLRAARAGRRRPGSAPR